MSISAASRQSLQLGLAFLAYWVSVAVYSYLQRFEEFAYPPLLFFAGFWLLPCATSAVPVWLARHSGLAVRTLAAAVGVVSVWLVASRQVRPIARYVVSHGDHEAIGLYNNFFVTSWKLIQQPALYASVVLLLAAVFGVRWLGPNNSSKPTPLRGAA